MNETTYRSLIDEKIADWEGALRKLKEQADQANTDTRERLGQMIEQFTAAIEKARVELMELDASESVENTMEIKNKIIAVFNSVDQEFKEYVDITPFML